MATQVALHHNWLPRDRLEHTAPRSTNPTPTGNICPSSQHFCYTGETAVDVAGLEVSQDQILGKGPYADPQVQALYDEEILSLCHKVALHA